MNYDAIFNFVAVLLIVGAYIYYQKVKSTKETGKEVPCKKCGNKLDKLIDKGDDKFTYECGKCGDRDFYTQKEIEALPNISATQPKH